MTKEEALQMCLEYIETNAHERKYVRHAIKQALALDKMAENARELGLDYEPVGEAYLCDKCQTPFDGAWECPNCGHRSATKESVYTTPPAAQPVIPDAMTSADIEEHIEYVAGWNDCRQAMLEMMK